MQRANIHLTDTHCHLYSAEFDADRHDMITRAIDSGVQRMMMPNIDLDSIEPMMSICSEFPQHCFPMMGLHPCSVREDYKDVLKKMRYFIDANEVFGIGETGVDLYWDTTLKDKQVEAFEEQISIGIEKNLPVIIHSRESLDLNIGIIKNRQTDNLKGIFHCFGGTYEQAISIYEAGFKLGIGGIATFKKSPLIALLPKLPVDSIVLETDAPYLAPVPYRGKRNESSYLISIAEIVASCLNISMAEVSRITNSNANEVFGKIE